MSARPTATMRADSSSTSRARGSPATTRNIGYRIYRLDRRCSPARRRELALRDPALSSAASATGATTRGSSRNGTFLNNFELAPAHRHGPHRSAPGARRSAANTACPPSCARPSWRTSRRPAGAISAAAGRRRTSPSRPLADQIPIAPGKKVSRRRPRRPAHRPLRLRRADPHLLLDPVGPLCGEAPAPCRSRPRRLLPPDPRLERRPDARRAPGRRSTITSANFGPYQFDQARIIEFPGYATFAQAFANTMPYSEAIGFVADDSATRTRSTTSPTSPPTSSATNSGRTR